MELTKRKRPPDAPDIGIAPLRPASLHPRARKQPSVVPADDVVLESKREHPLVIAHSVEAKLKRKRPDVTARRATNAGTTVSVVKTTLNSFCKEEGKALPWESVLQDMNKAVLEAYVLANIHVVRLCQANLPIESLNNTFFYRCLSAVVSDKQKFRDCEQLKQSAVLYNEWRATNVDRAKNKYISSGWQQNASLQMARNTSNAVNFNFYQRFHKHLKRKYDFDGRHVYGKMKRILDPEYDGDDPVVLEWRARIPRREFDGKLDSRPHLLLPLTYLFLFDIEERNRENKAAPDYVQIRSFSLLPYKRGFECSHFKMCKAGLWALLRRAEIKVPHQGTGWNEVADEWWRELFHVDKFETVNRKFAGEIVTDGKSVSISMRKPKREPVIRELNAKDYDVMWGLDPGRTDLFVASNQNGEKVSCSAREFYEDARYKKRNQKIRVWQENRPDVLEATRNMPTKKTSSLERLKEYVEFMIPRMDLLLKFAMVKPFRKLKLRSYIFAKKKLRELCLKLTAQAGRRTLVGFGDWSNQDIGGLIKKCPAGPVKPFERMLRQYCRVEPIDEFRTSKLHERCHSPLVHQYSKRMCRDGVERTLKVHGVLHCKNNGCHGMTVNRDENASKNMLLLLQRKIQGEERPSEFCRART